MRDDQTRLDALRQLQQIDPQDQHIRALQWLWKRRDDRKLDLRAQAQERRTA